MTPIEKAKDLVERFRMNVLDYDGCSINTHKAKQCALIAVDEAVNIFIGIHKKLIEIDMIKGNVEDTATYQYWKQVKTEIENL